MVECGQTTAVRPAKISKAADFGRCKRCQAHLESGRAAPAETTGVSHLATPRHNGRSGHSRRRQRAALIEMPPARGSIATRVSVLVGNPCWTQPRSVLDMGRQSVPCG